MELRVVRKRHFNGDGWDIEDTLQYAVYAEMYCGEYTKEWKDVPVIEEEK